ncbi:hypothetical protein Y032_0103g3562 [Ancylostoma ceylanicum]|uniref:Uncharacterized protein n=1 Tax=Ancylostoma ceylanicum TaxID=53326 RepID=A0A016TG61_9BILA|nr:hypothetical protein Y032_0103g3562 [Ancylostoma ceylanicum]
MLGVFVTLSFLAVIIQTFPFRIIMFEHSRVVAFLLARFGPGDGSCANRDERKMAEAFGRILFEASYSEVPCSNLSNFTSTT